MVGEWITHLDLDAHRRAAKYEMPPSCSSARRCSSTSCPGCAWRYSLRVCGRIQARQPRHLHAVTIECSTQGEWEFRAWRKSIHNAVAYQRERSRWWRDFGLWGWHNGSDLHGIVALGSITKAEFMSAFRRHGDVRLRPVDIENVRIEVYAAALTVSDIPAPTWIARYQPIKITIEPLTASAFRTPKASNPVYEPMSVLF